MIGIAVPQDAELVGTQVLLPVAGVDTICLRLQAEIWETMSQNKYCCRLRVKTASEFMC